MVQPDSTTDDEELRVIERLLRSFGIALPPVELPTDTDLDSAPDSDAAPDMIGTLVDRRLTPFD